MWRTRADVAFSLLVLLLFAGLALETRGWNFLARFFPLVVAVPAIGLASLQLVFAVRNARNPAAAPRIYQPERLVLEPPAGPRDARLLMLAWVLLSTIAVVVLGFTLTVPLSVLAFMRVLAHEKWQPSIIASAATYVLFLAGFRYLLHIPLPGGWIADALGVVSLDSQLLQLLLSGVT